MNYKLICRYLGRVLVLLAASMVLPLSVSVIYRDFMTVRAIIYSVIILLAIGLPMGMIRCDVTKMYPKEGFLIVAISWVSMSAFGALPFYFSGEIPSYIDCFFESVSGFTTTGASIVTNMNHLSSGIIFWQAFTHWIGGMGVLVFLMAVIPAVAGERTLSVLKAESTGPTPGKLVPKMRQSSMLLYIIYLALTLLEIILLCAGGMPLFDSMVNSMSTAGTGGFSAGNGSIEVYGSVYAEVVITVFMVIFSINFNVFYFMLLRNVAGALKNEELRVFLAIIVTSVAVITWNLTGNNYETVGESLRFASFNVCSFMTTTGFASADFAAWPTLSKTILLILMFVGGCSGSTAGGIKVSRIIIMVKECRRSISQIIRPRSVEIVKMDGKAVDKAVVQSACCHGLICAALFVASLLVLSLENLDMESTVSIAATTLNNVGQGFGVIGPRAGGAGFSGFSDFTKLALSLNMLLGRLEFYPMLLLLSPRTWTRR